jgi:hypothetical protein
MHTRDGDSYRTSSALATFRVSGIIRVLQSLLKVSSTASQLGGRHQTRPVTRQTRSQTRPVRPYGVP